MVLPQQRYDAQSLWKNQNKEILKKSELQSAPGKALQGGKRYGPVVLFSLRVDPRCGNGYRATRTLHATGAAVLTCHK